MHNKIIDDQDEKVTESQSIKLLHSAVTGVNHLPTVLNTWNTSVCKKRNGDLLALSFCYYTNGRRKKTIGEEEILSVMKTNLETKTEASGALKQQNVEMEIDQTKEE